MIGTRIRARTAAAFHLVCMPDKEPEGGENGIVAVVFGREQHTYNLDYSSAMSTGCLGVPAAEDAFDSLMCCIQETCGPWEAIERDNGRWQDEPCASDLPGYRYVEDMGRWPDLVASDPVVGGAIRLDGGAWQILPHTIKLCRLIMMSDVSHQIIVAWRP